MKKILLPLLILSIYGFFNLLGINSFLARNQLIYLLLAFVFFFIIKKINKRFFFENVEIFYWFFIGILIITFLIGIEVKGSKRWLDFYFFRFQPSEFLKIFFIIYLAKKLSKMGEKGPIFFDFLKSFFYFLIPALIVVNQPDLGNSLAFFFIYLVMISFSSIPKLYLYRLFFVLIILFPLFWHFLKPYQKQRIISFLNPQSNYQTSAYNMIQSVIAVGSGNFFGRGMGYGTQAKLYFLPEQTTDFAFASLVEQFGFISGAIVIFLYFYILFRLLISIFSDLSHSQMMEKERLYLKIGLAAYIFFQVVVNIGMVLGLLPVVGVALPIISYGGSAIITFFFAMAMAF